MVFYEKTILISMTALDVRLKLQVFPMRENSLVTCAG